MVIFATNISLSKMFAKKRGYSIDPNQVCISDERIGDESIERTHGSMPGLRIFFER